MCIRDRASSQLAGHGFDTHPHPRFFFTVLGHIQDGNKTTDEGTDDHEPDHKQAADLAVYFNTTNGDVTSPRSSPSTSTSLSATIFRPGGRKFKTHRNTPVQSGLVWRITEAQPTWCAVGFLVTSRKWLWTI